MTSIVTTARMAASGTRSDAANSGARRNAFMGVRGPGAARGSDVGYSAAALQWLEAVLIERFGAPLTLTVEDDRRVRLGLHGSNRRLLLHTDASTFTRADSDLPCARWDAAAEGWAPALPGKLPAPGGANLYTPIFQPDAQGISVNYDILGLTYWMLSRQEEVGRPERDEHQRFPAAASHALRHGYLERPVVDEWLAILGQAINRVWPQFPRQRSTFSMRISHDVDWPSRYGFSGPPHLMRMMLSDLINGRSMREVLRAPFIRMATRHQLLAGDPNNTFDWIMDLSDRHGLTSAFYFICGRTNPGMDATYELGHPAIRALLRRIHARGHEIGLHPSYHTYRDPHAFAREASYLRQICAEEGISQLEWGGRMHILRWETPTTLRNWESVGMHYDSTLSYADRPGFRCGTCFEYPAFDPVEQAALNLRIRPLIAMECTIMAPRYLGLGTGDAAHEKFRQLKDACRSVAGCFTLLWHNSEFETEDKRRLYAALLH